MECHQRRTDEDLHLRERSGTRLTTSYIKGSETRPNVDPIPESTPQESVTDGMTDPYQGETNTLKQKKPHKAAFRSS